MHVPAIYANERHFHCYVKATGHIRWRQLVTLKAVREVAELKHARRFELALGDLDYIFWTAGPVGEAAIKQAFSQRLFGELPGPRR